MALCCFTSLRSRAELTIAAFAPETAKHQNECFLVKWVQSISTKGEQRITDCVWVSEIAFLRSFTQLFLSRYRCQSANRQSIPTLRSNVRILLGTAEKTRNEATFTEMLTHHSGVLDVSKFIRISSTTNGRRIIRILIFMIYSPNRPMKNSCMPPNAKTPMLMAAIPVG